MTEVNNKQLRLDSLQGEILTNNICPDLAKQATQLVFGSGNPAADVVLIGEAPGKNEDIKGEPFVGAAGKFLNEMLESIGLERDDIYITNIVKYRPPNNRDPLPAEKKEFWPYLVRQLNIIQPKLVVTLGRHSMEYFLPGAKISAIHGQPKRIRTSTEAADKASPQEVLEAGEHDLAEAKTVPLVILPLYHPAAALYNGAMRQTLMEDFSEIPRILKTI